MIRQTNKEFIKNNVFMNLENGEVEQFQYNKKFYIEAYNQIELNELLGSEIDDKIYLKMLKDLIINKCVGFMIEIDENLSYKLEY